MVEGVDVRIKTCICANERMWKQYFDKIISKHLLISTKYQCYLFFPCFTRCLLHCICRHQFLPPTHTVHKTTFSRFSHYKIRDLPRWSRNCSSSLFSSYLRLALSLSKVRFRLKSLSNHRRRYYGDLWWILYFHSVSPFIPSLIIHSAYFSSYNLVWRLFFLYLRKRNFCHHFLANNSHFLLFLCNSSFQPRMRLL